MWNTNLLYSECLFSLHMLRHHIQTQMYRPALSTSGSPAVKMYRPALSTSRNNQSYMGHLCNYTSFRDDWLSSLQMNLMRVLLIDGYRMQPGMIHTPTHWCLLVWNANLSASIPVPSGPGPHRLQEIVMEFGCLELVPTKEPPNPLHHQPFIVLCINN